MKIHLHIALLLLTASVCYAKLPGISVTNPNPYYHIISISEDDKGMLWFGTDGNGLFRFDGRSYVRFSPDEDQEGSLLSGHISSILSDSKNRLWAGTQNGINMLQRGTRQLLSYSIEDSNQYVTEVTEDPFSRILLTTEAGLFLLDNDAGSFQKVIPFKDNYYRGIILSDSESIWVVYGQFIERYDVNFNFIGTYPSPATILSAEYDGEGLIYLRCASEFICFDTSRSAFVPAPAALRNADTGAVTLMDRFSDSGLIFVANGKHYYFDFESERLVSESDPSFPYDVPNTDSRLLFIYSGPSGVVWEVTEDGRILSPATDTSNPYRQLCREYDNVTVPGVVSDGNSLWFVVDGAKLVTYDIVKRTLREDNIRGIVGERGQSQYYSIYRDDFSGKLFLYSAYNVYEVAATDSGEYSVERTYSKKPGSSIDAITVDKRKTLWASCWYDPDLYFTSRGTESGPVPFETKVMDPDTPRIYISALYTLRNGDVVAAYTDIGLAIIKATTGEVSFVRLSDKYGQMYIHSLYEDAKGNIWAGTSDVGLFIYHPDTGEVEMPEEFEGKNIRTICGDSRGNVLFMNQSTLFSYNPDDRSFQPIWRTPDADPDKYGRVFPMEDGLLLINSGRRFVAIERNADRNRTLTYGVDVILADRTSDVLTVLQAGSFENGTPTVTFPPSQKNFRMILSTPDFSGEPLLYKYRVSGLTDGWENTFNDPAIPLNNLSYGKHRIEFQLTDIAGDALDEPSALTLRIRRPLLQSIAAYIAYALLLLLMITSIIQLLISRRKKVLEAERIRKEKEFQEKMNEDNIDFFANMSHEFRTPLSIISAAVATMENDSSASASQVRLQKIVRRNCDRMLKLVSQLLDFNRLEHNKLPLSVQLTDANAAIKDIVELFSIGADQKDISLTVEGADNQLFTWLDPDIFEKVMYNLLSNAIKYTPTGGSIKVRSKVCSDVSSLFPGKEHKDGDHLVVEVADSGIGIPEESLSLIFERFGQAFPSQKKSGTGIGLYFAKAMVELHHGFIKAGNDGGAVFTFALPMSQGAYSEFERSHKEDTVRAVDNKRYLSEYTAGSETPQPVSDITILVIDDDYEIVYFLKTILSPHYKVVSTFDAMSGYKMIESEDPDIIISDVMMYEMDGIQFCKMVKENGDYCHIPLILLTAKSSVANQIEGLNAGADAYIVKPFDPDYLLATIGTLLRNRENVRNILGRSTKVGKALDDSVSAKDRKLLETVYTLFEENLSNTDINAGDFADKCGISRTKFFYKVKALTGMTPAEYFRAYKLNRAVELIKEDKYKMSGIAEMCGFSSPSHFATSFKKHFGVLPSEYLDSL